MSTKRRKSPFHVGDRVRAPFGRRTFTGVIVEDRGALGPQRQHLFRVEFPIDPFDPWSMELLEDEMEVIPPGTEVDQPLDKQQVIDYLVNGGLISMLWSNLQGGKYQPRAWLCRSQLGNVTYTLVPERGMIGGQWVPSAAVHGHEILTAKRDAVRSFVESFGLNREEAEKVIAKVGTAP